MATRYLNDKFVFGFSYILLYLEEACNMTFFCFFFVLTGMVY